MFVFQALTTDRANKEGVAIAGDDLELRRTKVTVTRTPDGVGPGMQRRPALRAWIRLSVSKR